MRTTIRRDSLATLVFCAMVSSPALAVTLPAFDLPQIGSIDVPGTAKPGDPVRITIKAEKDGTSACGMVVSFGDGTSQQLKVNVENTKLPFSVEHVYKKSGKYTVQATGKKITTHHSCKGSASATVNVSTGATRKSAKAAKTKN